MIPPSQPIETLTVMAYGSQTKVACYAARNGQIRFLCGSAYILLVLSDDSSAM